MFLQYPQTDLIVEMLYLIKYLALILIFYAAIKMGLRIKEAGMKSATTGFTIFLISLGVFQINSSLIFPPDTPIIEITLSIQLIFGIILFILFAEMDSIIHENIEKTIKYPITIISLIITALFFPLAIFLNVNDIIGFAIITIPFIILVIRFIKKFGALEMVKKSRPEIWFLTGLIISSYSNFLAAQELINTLGFDTIFVLQKLCVIFGVLMMVWGWNRLPNLSELDWLTKIERLLIIHTNTSILLYQYDFQLIGGDYTSEVPDGQITGSAIGGMDMLLKEILVSEGRIKEIDHGGKKIYFNHGNHTIAVLVASNHADEFKYRIEMLQLEFEKKFSYELDNWDGRIDPFGATKDLIRQYFLQ